MCELTGKPNRRILVIDDNRSIHDDFKKILCGSDDVEDVSEDEAALFNAEITPSSEVTYEVDSAYQGDEGLARVVDALKSGHPYTMVFVDMRMPPGWDGLETITLLWQEDPCLEIVMCTAYSDYSWSEISKRLGFPNQLLILKKPFDNTEIAQLAASLTEKWNLARRVKLRMDQLQQSITDRTKQIERAHRETESLLAAISSLLIGVDQIGIINRWNKSAEELFGILACEAVGKPLNELDIEWDDPETADRLFKAYKTGGITRRALKLVRNNSIRVIGISTYPVTNNGVDRGLICLGTDITKQTELEQQLQQAQKLEAVGQLAAGVAHEINTPMQYVGDNLEFLKKKVKRLEPLLKNFSKFLQVAKEAGWESELLAETKIQLKKLGAKSFFEQVSEAIDDSRDGVQHVSRIVRAMKEFAHPGQDEKTPVDINRALESTIAVSTNEWKYVAEIETNFDTSIPLVPALSGELNQVFLNILVNAAHAIGETGDDGLPSKGRITISTRSEGEHVEVLIADSGTGIPDEIKPRIFDPFFTTKEIGKGTGQGLAIAHSVVVRKHGGSLRCDSSPGVGTTFIVQLPVEASVNLTHDQLEPAVVCE